MGDIFSDFSSLDDSDDSDDMNFDLTNFNEMVQETLDKWSGNDSSDIDSDWGDWGGYDDFGW